MSSRSATSQNSARAGEELAVGRVGAAHGVRGQVRVEPLTDYPERFARLGEVCLELRDGHRRPAAVERATVDARGRVLLKFAGCDDRAAAQALRGAYILIPREQAVTLPQGHYFVDEVVGLQVVTTGGEGLGQVREVLRTPAHDVYVADEVMIPATRQVVRKIDLEAGVMVVDLPEEI